MDIDSISNLFIWKEKHRSEGLFLANIVQRALEYSTQYEMDIDSF